MNGSCNLTINIISIINKIIDKMRTQRYVILQRRGARLRKRAIAAASASLIIIREAVERRITFPD
jgi:hypothetical protein